MHWSDLVSTFRLDILALLAVSGVLGAAVGLEREIAGKSAGLRTNALICFGSCLFTLCSIGVTASGRGDPARIAAQIVTGVGFIGAGTILRGRGTAVLGLTSAATIWVVAAIGMAVGIGWVLEAAGATLFLLIVLAILGRLERYVHRRIGSSHLSVRVKADPKNVDNIQEVMGQAGVKVEELETDVEGDVMTVNLRIQGPQHSRDRAKLEVMRATGIWSVSDLDHPGEPKRRKTD